MIHTDPVQPEAEAIRAQLERTLASRGFVTAGRQSRLLRHIVERTLAGQADQLKEYSVGMEVFDRDEKYDPRIDSIVRVEAGRLRSRLDEYYATDGAGDAVRISLPRGAYVATFEPNVQGAKPAVTLNEAAPIAAEQPAARSSWALWALGAALVAVVAGMVMWLGEPQASPGAPSVAVLAFEQYSASEDDGAIAAQLTDNVTAELARLGTVGVVSHTSAMQFAGERKPLREIAQALNAAFIVEGSVENVAGGIRVMARIVNATTDRKMWVQDFAGRPDDLRTLSKSIAAGVSEAVLKGPPAP
jgi:TolB-like protein